MAEQGTGSGTAAAEPKRRNALGKGIESLLGPRAGSVGTLQGSAGGATAAGTPATPVVAAPDPGLLAAAAAGAAGRPLEIAVDRIERNPYQTRTTFDQAKLEELATSIRASGVHQPVVVRALPEGRYQLVTGERRWRASQLAGKETVPAIVRTLSDAQAMEMTIVENLQREDLNPMEQARAFDRLGRDFRLTQEEMAERTGKDRASIGNFMRLLRLPKMVQTMIEEGHLAMGHGRALLALPTREEMESCAQFIAVDGMSVRNAELYIAERLMPADRPEKKKKPARPTDPNVWAAQERLQRRLGLRVSIEDRKGKGKVIIEYSGVDDFDSLLTALGGAE